MKQLLRTIFICAVCFSAARTFAAPIPVASVKKDSDGITLQMKPGAMRLEVYSPRIIRVTYAAQDELPDLTSLAVIAKARRTKWTWRETKDEIILRTDEVQVRVNRMTGAVLFFDKSGKLIVAENPDGGKSLTPNQINGMNTLRSRDEFVLSPHEAIYGLGQHQNGLMNYRGAMIHLQQRNPTQSAVPVLVSSRGYGVLWDNPAITDVNVGGGVKQSIPTDQFYTEAGQPGGLTARYYSGTNFDMLVATRTNANVDFDWSQTPPPGLPHDYYSVRWDGYVKARQGGKYTFVTSSDDGARLWIDGRPVINDWSVHAQQTDRATVTFAAGSRHRIRLEYFQAAGQAVVRLDWELPSKASFVEWASEAADSVDYYFMYGPALDQVVADYRRLTGAAPMFGKWAWGLWQCKNHYTSQKQILGVVARYRRLRIPLDNIIQDWQYWTPNPWGSHRFDTNRYPDVTQMMHELHANHMHLIISVWARFDVGCSNWLQLKDADALYPQVLNNVYPPGKGQWYDPFNPVGRRIYWDQISKALFSKGIDGWWLDASEPELSGHWGEFQNYMTADGPGFKVFNAYPLMHTTAVYQGQRAQISKKRVFILTRSGYAGQQRNAAVTWSGDIQATWDVFASQIPAGLNFSISGIPYWNTDTGGFFDHSASDPAYAELFTRWFQFSAFCPMFRIHGNHDKALYNFPPAIEAILIQYDKLRYHLLPYIYSVSWMVTHDSYTMMRPLVMDFSHDTNVYDIGNQYMFGPALMVCPVTTAGATTRKVYLPADAQWTDFWTGKTYPGGQTIETAAPVETLPLFVRAGSILTYGPPIQHATEEDNPMDLRIYCGADGHFTLYEDEGDNYDYEKGEYATIPIFWNQAVHTLEIGKRAGQFPGMLKERTFHIVWVSADHGVGIASTEKPDAVVHYNGHAVKISGP
jgi:alpha-D-xyloside xylohydrolase